MSLEATSTDFDDLSPEEDALLDHAEGAPALPHRKIPALIWAVVSHPRSALSEVAERGRWVWLVPIVTLAILSTIHAAVSLPRAREAAMQEMTSQFESASADMSPEQAAELEATRDTTVGIMFRVTGIFTILGGLLVPFLAVLVLAAILHFGGTVVGGQQTFGQMLAVVAWARWPLVFQAALRLVYAFTGGYDLRMEGLAGLVTKESVLGPLLSEVSVWNLWALALTVLAVVIVSRVSRGKAIAVVGAVIVLRLALGLVGVALGRFAAGLGGG